MAYVAFTGLHGEAILLNTADTDIAELTAIATTALPAGVTDGTNIDYDDGRRIQVQGTPTATANTLVGGGVAPSNAVYVDPAGNNATGQRGSAAFPFLTMAAAAAVLHSGDELLVSPGSYTGTGNHFTLPAIASVTIRGSGEFAGQTVISGAAGEDVITLNAANRAVTIENIQVAGLTTGRAVVGTGATAARLFLDPATAGGGGLFFSDVILSSAAGVAVVLTYAGLVEFLDSQITLGGATFNVCGNVSMLATAMPSNAIAYSWDEADALRPAAGQGTLSILAGTKTGAVTLSSTAVNATHGSPKLEVSAGSEIGALTGSNLDDVAAAHLSIIVRGTVGAVDFQSAAGKVLPAATANTLVLDFQGAILSASGASAMLWKATTNFQTVSANGLICKAAATFTADAKIHLTLTGAALTSPSYPTPGADGDILPPELSGVVNIAAGGAQTFTWAQLGYTGLVRVSSAVHSPTITPNVQATDAVIPIASKTALGFGVTSSAQAGNTAAGWTTSWAA